MKNRFLILILAAFLLLPAATAQAGQVESVNVTFSISEDGAVKHTLDYTFTNPVSEMLNYTVDDRVELVGAYTKDKVLNPKLAKSGDAYTIRIPLEEPTSQISLEYTKKDAVFSGEDSDLFYTELQFDSTIQINSRILLPEGKSVAGKNYRPPNSEITSDGERIIVEWSGEAESQAFLVRYKGGESNLWIAAAFILLILLVITYFKSREKAREEFLRGFDDSERKVIQYLEEHGECLQKDLQREFQLSKSKTTRIVKKLEEKDLVEKYQHGRTNKLTWVK